METARTPPPPRPRVSSSSSESPVLSSPPTPALALQPRSCIAPWRPSSELSQGRKRQGAARGEIAEGSGEPACYWVLLPAAGARGQWPQSARLSSLTQRPCRADASISPPRASLSPGGSRVTRWE
ncbi:unnamed protein product [Rangifer tarandus platyrhynchus]|uniref:Uncharacterized protein n=2 Tax=Rangifer tarandus platyrhynchus TaxID=3082113 RepID=A0AC59ZE17_RANTA|nr:unnamed protein product [Rangifer tarandus platyrhynchus]